ncbi:MbnP family copper-binding protein [Calothrix sp. UHCC 0171]|uniref:MbnP family copper-binding protein n=1 Tax=Calothrix sp. UHCC 0171 TaxID=3110245 RepID=UPI002B2061B8|nr:MbnP family copper-binding protein [Calothrix sp. UHCC 0171]MEA5573502.1 MbnP family copper-binding protein [Calothrix sp. UHCC 0171]
MRSKIQSATSVLIFFVAFSLWHHYTSHKVNAASTQEVTIKFAAKVGDQPFNCGSNYKLGKPATTVTPLDFRFYISDIHLIDNKNKSIPLSLNQDGKWQYQNVALIDFENKTGACANGTVETRNIVVGKIPQGQYKAIKFTLGLPENLNHEDSTLAPSPLNLTSLWWNWQFGYKFARIDFARLTKSQPTDTHQHKHGEKEAVNAFFIHLGSTGCQAETASQKPTTKCTNPNTAIINLANFEPSKNTIVIDIAKLVGDTNLTRNQENTAPGCMSEPNDKDCTGIMAGFGIPFGGQTSVKQTFFSVK